MRLSLVCSFIGLSLVLGWSGAARAQATRALSGVVVSEGGGVAGATIQVKDRPLTITSGADGTFVLAQVPISEVVLQVSAEGYLSVEVPVKAGRVAAVFAVTLAKLPPPAPAPVRAVVVLVRDRTTGAGIANATVKVQGTELTAQTDRDGLCVLRDLPVAELVLELGADEHEAAWVTVAAEEVAAKGELWPLKVAAPAPSPSPSPSPAPPAAAVAAPVSSQEALAEAEREVFLVTGSALERKELTTVAPVSSLDRRALEAAGLSTVGDILQNLPAQSNGINAQANNGGDGSTRINLRGLGSNRTLTLINGRRVVPGGTGADASVDLNAIPLAVIERVEVLKDGGSVIYGSDAIGGVVNVITRREFNGSEATLYTGTTTRGDGFGYDVSLVTGTSSKKGNVLFAGGYQSQEPVFAGDREFSNVDKQYYYEAKESIDIGSSAIPAGRFTHSGTQNICGTNSSNANIRVCRRDGNGYAAFSAPGDLYNYQPENYLFTPSERYNVFSTGSYKVTDKVRAFFEGSYINRKSDQRLAPEPLFTASAGIAISADSVYNPIGENIVDYRRRLVEFGPRRSLQNIDTFRIVTGVEGSLPESLPVLKDWKWELSYNFGRTQATQLNEGNLIVSRLASALGPSFFDAGGTARCGTSNARIDGCVPMNVMAGADANAITQEMIDYVTFTGVSTGYNRQQTLLGTMHGRLARTPWGGDLALALGASHRREAGGFTPDALISTGDTTVPEAPRERLSVFSAPPDPAWLPAEGSYHVTEGFAELSVVPVVGQGFVQWLELDAAARAFDYSTFGRGLTGKIGGLFRTLGGVSLRGSYSTAFRAPNVGELFSSSAYRIQPFDDPCAPLFAEPPTSDRRPERCRAEGIPLGFLSFPDRVRTGGNPRLSEETAKIFTVGLVVEPPAAQGLALTLDYFHTDLADTIQVRGVDVIVSACYYGDDQESCDRITRNPETFDIEVVDESPANLGGTRTSGLDFSVSYDRQFRFGHLRTLLEGTYLLDFEVDNLAEPDRPLQARGNYDFGVFPALRANLTTQWAKDGLSAGFSLHFVGGFDECEMGASGTDRYCNDLDRDDADLDGMDNTQEDEIFRNTFTRSVDSNLTADLFAGYSLTTKAGVTSLSVGVNNVLDRAPPLIYSGLAGDSDSTAYDYLGRFVYARMSQRF